MNQNEMIAGYVGTDPVQRLYMGTELVWPLGPGPAPTPTPYEEQYFTVEMVSAGTFYISQNRTTGLYYSLNGGAWTAASTSMNLSAGDKVRFKGDLEDIVPTTMFTGNTTPFIVYGNIMSMGYPDNFSTSSPIPETGYFMGMFKGSTGLADALNLVMPTGVTANCYDGMFSGCTSLEYAPWLPAETLANYCYQNMFAGCTSLKYIKCLATNLSATNCTYNWVSGITTDGVFVQASGSTWTDGVNGIPTTWNPIYAPQHDDGLWVQFQSGESGDWLEDSGTTEDMGATYTFPELFNYGPIGRFSLFLDGRYVFLDEVDICGYDTDGNDPPEEICGGEGGDDGEGNYIECLIMTGDTRYISPSYQVMDITYTPASNMLSIQTHSEDCGAVDCDNMWEDAGYSSCWDCIVQTEGYSVVPLTLEIETNGRLYFHTGSRNPGRPDYFDFRYVIINDDGTIAQDRKSTFQLDRYTDILNLNVTAGQKVMLFGTTPGWGTPGSYDMGTAGYTTFSGSTCQYKVSGNILSMIDVNGKYIDEFYDQYWLTRIEETTFYEIYDNFGTPGNQGSGQFISMFRGSPVTDASNLILPTDMANTNLSLTNAYGNMFKECTSLTTAPVLPYEGDGSNPTGVAQNYRSMFDGCSSLTYVECHAVGNFSQISNFNYWLRNTGSNAIFMKNQNSTWSRGTGDGDIPLNWTLQDIS